jgi:predicted TIM-barrel fold metal-dependent hydrolase
VEAIVRGRSHQLSTFHESSQSSLRQPHATSEGLAKTWRIDCEVHMGEFRGDLYKWLGREIDANELNALLIEHHFDLAIVMPSVAQRPDNDQVGRGIKGQSRLKGFAMINPYEDDGGVYELERAVGEWGAVGLKLVPLRHGYDCDGSVPLKVMKCAERLELPVSIHSGAHYCLPWQIGALAKRFPSVPVIMDHMGWRYYVEGALDVAADTPNVYLETAMVSMPGYIRMAVDRLGAERVIYGSDFPTGDPASMIAVIRAAGLTPDQDAMVMGGTLAKLLRLAPTPPKY